MNHSTDSVTGVSGSDTLPAGFVLKNVQYGRAYRLVRVLGKGGFGITYQAQTIPGGNVVAVKEFYPRGMVVRAGDNTIQVINCNVSMDEMMSSFLKEIKILHGLQNTQSVVKIYDYFYANNTAYYVMEYIAGDDLRAYIKKRGLLQPAQWQNQIRQLMRDINQLHSNGVIHRDISPDNIKLTPENTLKLIDFGSARAFVNTQNLTVSLKEEFAPIEQYGTSGQGAYTDVYTLAATLYYCFTGKLVPQSLKRQVRDDLIPPSALGVKIGGREEKALLKALAVSPKDRFQTMREFEQAYFREPVPLGEATTQKPDLLDNVRDSLERIKEDPILFVAGMALLIIAVSAQLLL